MKVSPAEPECVQMLIVQKYGGATLSDPAKIRKVAARIQSYVAQGHQIVAIVSAMGKTTNELLALAGQVSAQPLLRELDMLLTTGERVSMALVSMALNDVGVSAISFTGSQAGVLTNDSHVNALITDVKAFRVREAIDSGKVVVLAGFQGVSPVTKEITTLGRGGTDTTAVAIACYLKADRCEIVKDVAGVFTADPNLISEARNIPALTYEELADMTFGGAKVLHYRAIELASRHRMPLLIGPMEEIEKYGTAIVAQVKGRTMYEKVSVSSLNSFDKVIGLSARAESASEMLRCLRLELQTHQIADPQYLHFTQIRDQAQMFLTGPAEILEAIEKRFPASSNTDAGFAIDARYSLVTATCTGAAAPDLSELIARQLTEKHIPVAYFWTSAMSVFLLVERDKRVAALKALHELIPHV